MPTYDRLISIILAMDAISFMADFCYLKLRDVECDKILNCPAWGQITLNKLHRYVFHTISSMKSNTDWSKLKGKYEA